MEIIIYIKENTLNLDIDVHIINNIIISSKHFFNPVVIKYLF